MPNEANKWGKITFRPADSTIRRSSQVINALFCVAESGCGKAYLPTLNTDDSGGLVRYVMKHSARNLHVCRLVLVLLLLWALFGMLGLVGSAVSGFVSSSLSQVPLFLLMITLSSRATQILVH